MTSNLLTKWSVGTTLFIVVLGVGFGTRQLSEIAQLERQFEEAPAQSDRSSSRRKTVAPSGEPITGLMAKLVELEPYGKDDANLDRRMFDAKFKIQIATLSSSESEAVVRQILESGDELTKSEVRVCRYCLVSLAAENPRTALELIKAGQDHPAFPGVHQFRKAAQIALVNLGISDLDAVNEWFSTAPVSSERPDVEYTEVLLEIFEQRSSRNYGEAFELIDQDVPAGLTRTWAMYGVHNSLTLERAKDYLSAVRDSKLSQDMKDEALEAFGTQYLGNGPEDVISWIAKNNFTYDEIRGVLNGLNRRGTGSQQAEWINWISEDSMARNRFSGAYKNAVRNLLASLIDEDFVAAGHLINSLPEGSKMKEFASSQYAAGVSSLNLEVAIEWFETTPKSSEKIRIGKDLYHKLFLKDPIQAEKFAIENGLYVE